MWKRLINEYVRKGRVVVAVTHGFGPVALAEELY
jgi:hypothetical protein